MGLESFLEFETEARRSLAVVNRTSPRPVQQMLERLFEGQPIDVEETDIPDGENLVVLTDGEEVLASSPLEAIQDAILLVNSDVYVTGSRELTESTLPDVLAGLSDVPFRMRGYPESNSEKLLLISISRMIERRAWERDDGKLRSSFQYLSRIEDEQGTKSVYQSLAASGVDTHVYGIPNWTPSTRSDLTIHGGYDQDFRESWFVVFTDDAVDDDAALLAIETEPNVWEGFWTYDTDEIDDINRYIEREL
jgi:hypothetical protein